MSTNQAGKGDKPRPYSMAEWHATWERMEAAKRAAKESEKKKPKP